MSDELLTIREVAERLRLSTGTVYRHVSTGALEAVKLGDTAKAPIRITADAVERFTRTNRIGTDLAERAERIMELRGDISYEEALREAGDYSSAVFIDQIVARLTADTEDAFKRGYRVTSAAAGSDVVDIERIVREELDRLGRPLPDAVVQLGPKGLGQAALGILKAAGVTEYDGASFRQAVRRAIDDATNPKREIR